MATAIEAGKHISLEVARFRDLVAAGVFKRMPSGRYNLDVVREAYCRHMQKIAAGRAADGGAALSKERARLAKAQAASAEFRNKQTQGDFVSLGIMQKMLEQTFGVMRAIALGTPGKISDGLTPYTPKDRDAIFEIVRGEIFEMLTSLSDPDSYVIALEGART